MAEHDRRVERRQDRRKGSDSVLKILSVLGVFGWFLMLVALIVYDKARPKHVEFMINSIDANAQAPRLGWNDNLLYYVFVLMVIGFLISVVGLYLNAMRMRRRNDSYRVHLIFLLIISTLGIVYYLV